MTTTVYNNETNPYPWPDEPYSLSERTVLILNRVDSDTRGVYPVPAQAWVDDIARYWGDVDYVVVDSENQLPWDFLKNWFEGPAGDEGEKSDAGPTTNKFEFPTLNGSIDFGVWVAYTEQDFGATVAFMDELDALRYAVKEKMQVKFLAFGSVLDEV